MISLGHVTHFGQQGVSGSERVTSGLKRLGANVLSLSLSFPAAAILEGHIADNKGVRWRKSSTPDLNLWVGLNS